MVVGLEADEGDAAGVAAGLADAGDRGAHEHAVLGDEAEVVVSLIDFDGADEFFTGLQALDAHALAAARLAADEFDLAALAVAFGAGGEDFLLLAVRLKHGDYAFALFNVHAADAARGASHAAHLLLGEADDFAAAAAKDDFRIALGKQGADEVVALAKIDGDDAAGAWAREFAQGGFFDDAAASAHDDLHGAELVIFDAVGARIGQREDGGDSFLLG